MKITSKQHEALLEAFNKVKTATDNACDMHDLYMSDIQGLTDAIYTMKTVLNFVPELDEQGQPRFWSDFVIQNEDEKE